MNFVPPRPPPIPVPMVFTGERGEFRRLVMRGAALEFITAGFYRFWLATDMRRHLWSHTSIDGDLVEYTGRARELLFGFLFALAILMPIYLGYFLIGLEAERARAFASIPLFLFFYLFGQFAIYRARRYRLTRTVWRGVRFWMDGSGWAYAARSALWGVLVLLTLGLILPWREAALERYKMRHCYYGDLPGSFEGRGWDFFKRGWWLWLSVILLLVVPPVTLQLMYLTSALLPLAKITAAITPFLYLLVPFIYGLFKAVEWRWWISGLRFGEVWFESTLPSGALIGLYWKVIGWMLLLAVLFVAFWFACAAAIASMNGIPIAKLLAPATLQGNTVMLAPIVIGYLGLILAMNVVLRVYLQRDIWVRIVASTTVHDIEAAANVAGIGDLVSALGEGFADGLDVVGF